MIELDPCFVNTEKTWHYIIAAVPVVLCSFQHSSSDIIIMFATSAVTHQVIFTMLKGDDPWVYTNNTATNGLFFRPTSDVADKYEWLFCPCPYLPVDL